MTENRESGVDFGPLSEALESESYPLTNEELLDRHGDQEVSHAGGTASLREMLGELDDEYESAEEVRQAVFNMIGEESVGREEYSDRGLSIDEGDGDQESL